ncbi:MAG: hypothetical protein IPM36_13390 [Lewinellaceae bacterium]|nr:hypothetical protein [Lewinellaceae bacterium]
MKKSFLSLCCFLLTVALAQAQEDAGKLAKQAGRALTSYNIDPSNNGNKLEEAKSKMDQALQDAEVQANPASWITKGEIYNTILQRDMARRLLDPNAKLSGDNDALEAYNAFAKGYELATKSYQKTDAVKGIGEVQGHLINIGVTKYEAGAFEKAFQSFEAALNSHKILSENKATSLLDDPEQFNNQLYITALAAQLANKTDRAEAYYKQSYDNNTDKPAIYEGLYNVYQEKGDTTAADKVLAEGRKKFPNDPGLLFAEINAYLQKGKLEELISRLEQAIKQEPTNVSLWVTLGSVYDNLHQREMKAKNEEKAAEYFDKAKNNYEQAQNVDSTNVDAVYSLGALIFNKAAVRTQELNALPQDDFSAAALKNMKAARRDHRAVQPGITLFPESRKT